MRVIFGATGKVGEATATQLRRRGEHVRAVLRDPARGERLARLGCELAVAHLHDPDSVRRALDGAESALVVLPLRESADDLAAETRSIVDVYSSALAAAAPRTIVALSDYGAQHPAGTGIPELFHALELGLRGLPGLTLLRSCEHVENAARTLDLARTRGIWPSMRPLDRPHPGVAGRDVGALAADLLLAPPGAGRVVHIEGPRRHSERELAGFVGLKLGRAVAAIEVPAERRLPALIASGLSPDYARRLLELHAAHDAGRVEVEPGGELHRGPTGLAAALADL